MAIFMACFKVYTYYDYYDVWLNSLQVLFSALTTLYSRYNKRDQPAENSEINLDLFSNLLMFGCEHDSVL